jgi:chemotaxis protein methyltransferase CheR
VIPLEMSLDQFGKLCRVIYDKLGLMFDERKVHFLTKRVGLRMSALGIADISQYTFMLGYADPKGEEMQALANLITTNETYMFREYEQLQAFADYCLPEVVARKEKQGDRSLRIWSAGCSSGEEPYTLAIIIKEVFNDSSSWDIRIAATDVDEDRLAMARAAVYGDRSVKNVPEPYVARHFVQNGENFHVNPSITALVEVGHLNLSDRLQMRSMCDFDFIFCRNVLIYFDDQSRKAAVDHFYKALRPGGFIFLGHSESVGRISSAFSLRRLGESLVYMKPNV